MGRPCSEVFNNLLHLYVSLILLEIDFLTLFVVVESYLYLVRWVSGMIIQGKIFRVAVSLMPLLCAANNRAVTSEFKSKIPLKGRDKENKKK